MKNYLDKRIRERFKLFKNLRSKQDDEKLYLEIYNQIFKEMIKFLEENLDFSRMSFLIRELRMIEKGIKSEDKKNGAAYDALFRYLSSVPDVLFKLDRRIDHFINNLYVRSMDNYYK